MAFENDAGPCSSQPYTPRWLADTRLGPVEFGHLLDLYRVMHETQRYEGDGIWNRFNILISANIVLLGASGFVYSSTPQDDAAVVIVCLATAGGFLSAWAAYVLHSLWKWHRHWIQVIRQIECTFPPYLPRPLNIKARSGLRSRRWYRDWLLSYTQPIMYIFLVLWLSLLSLTMTGVISPGTP